MERFSNNNDIENIQLIPGPQGEQGIQGPKGDKGDTGAIPNTSNFATKTELPKMFTATAIGDGLTAIFTFPHGLGYQPQCVMVTPNSFAAATGKNDWGSGGSSTQIQDSRNYYAFADSYFVTIIYSKLSGSEYYYVNEEGYTVMIPESYQPLEEYTNLKWSILVK